MTTERTAPEEITAAVVASFDGCADPRLRRLMQSLAGTCTNSRGRSAWGPVQESSGSPVRGYGESIAEEPAGTPAWVYGRVLGVGGAPVAGAEFDVWQNGDNRLYAVQDPGAPEEHLRGRFRAREDGTYAFLGVRPVPYPIPDDGPVGRMLERTGRHPWRPAHLHMIVRAPGYRPLVTHIFDAASEYLDSDAVFAVKPSLLRRFAARAADDPERPEGVAGEWCSAEIDIVLVPGEAREVVDPGRTA